MNSEQIITDPKWWLANRGIPYSPDVYAGYGDHLPLSEERRQGISSLVTNLGKPVLAFTSLMPQEVGAAAITRYSRAKNPIRLIIADEFLDTGGLNLIAAAGIPRLVDHTRTKEYFGRILSNYGDDSPSQLGSVQVAAEMVSQIAVKEIEDARIGVSFIEKSSRYVDFTQRINGEYLFLRPKEIMESSNSGEFVSLMNEAFMITAAAFPKMLKIIRDKFPRGTEDEEAWKAATRGKTFDIIRGFLPMATLTNVGGSLDGQAHENNSNKMLVSWSHESRVVARDLAEEVDKVIPSLTQRIGSSYGVAARKFLQNRQDALRTIASELESKGLINEVEVGISEPVKQVRLKYATSGNVDRVVAGLLYPNKRITNDLVHQVALLSTDDKRKVIEASLEGRTNRRHKPPRAFEKAYYEFDIRSQVAEWRDLQRMRMDTLQRQKLTTEIGYGTPAEFNEVEIEFDGRSRKLSEVQQIHMEKRSQLFRKIEKDVSPEAAQFVVAFGNLMDWEIGVNLRQLYHMIPLRAGQGSHPLYKQIVLNMFFQIPPEDALLTVPMTQFLDFSDGDKLDRLAQLQKIRAKQLAEGYKDEDTFVSEN